MAELEKIITQFVADVSGYTAGMDKVTKSTQSATNLAGSAWTKLGATIKSAVGGFVAAFGAQRLFAATRQTLDWADNLKSLADRINISTDALQELIYAGREMNIEASAMTSGLRHFSVAMAEAASGRGRGVEAFKTMGFTIADTKKDLGELFDLFAERISEFDRPSQIALAKSFFGAEGATQFLDLLGKGKTHLEALRAAARAAGVVLKSDLIDRGEDMNNQVERLTDQIGAELKRAFIELGPIIIEAFKGALAFIRETKEFIQWIQGEGTGPKVGESADSGNIARIRTNWLSRGPGEGWQLTPRGWQRYVDGDIPPGEYPKAPGAPFHDESITGRNDAARGNTTSTPVAPGNKRFVSGAGAGEGLAEFDKKIRDARLEAEALQRELVFDKPFAEFMKMVAAFEDGNEKMKPLPDQVKRFKEEAEKIYSGKIQSAIKDYTRGTTEIIRLTEAEAYWNQDVARIMAEKIALEQQLGQEYAKTHPEIIQKLAEERIAAQKVQEKVKEGMENLRGVASDLGGAFSTAFGSAVLEGGKLSDVLKNLERDLMRIAMNRLINPAINSGFDALGGLFKNLLSGIGGGSGWGPDLFKSSKGNIFSSPVPHSKGGVTSGPGVFKMGDGRLGSHSENKPEAIFPIIRTSTGELGVHAVGGGRGGSGGGRLVVTVVNNTQAKASAEQGPDGNLMIMLDQMNEQLIGQQGSRTNRAFRQRFGSSPATISR